MKLLIVVDFFPDPPHHGSSVISYHWSRLLSRRHGVDLLCADEPRRPGWSAFYRRHGIGDPGIAVSRRSRVSQALGILRGYPPSVYRVDADELVARLGIAGGSRYDAAVVIGPSLLLVAESLQRHLPVLYVPYDAVSRVLESRDGPWPGVVDRLRWPVEAALWRRLERDRFPRLDGVVVVAREDAEAIGRHWPAGAADRLHVVTNGVDAAYFRANGAGEAEQELVFTGNLWTYDSVAGARWFVREVLPRIRRSHPSVRLRVVGRSPHTTLLELAETETGVEVVADVPDLRPHIERAAVYVCPLISGSGVKNRVLEAMAMGRPLVATSGCTQPLDLGPEVARTADDPARFAAEVVALLDSPGERRQLGARARRAVEERFSWDAAVRRVERILDGL